MTDEMVTEGKIGAGIVRLDGSVQGAADVAVWLKGRKRQHGREW